MNIPSLRFPEYKGEWEKKKLGKVMIEGKLGGNYENSESNGGIPVMKMGNINRGEINLDKIQFLPENEKFNENDTLIDGDLLFNTRNTLELVGKVAIWRNELPFSLYNSNLMRIRFNEMFEKSNRFMNAYFNTKKSINQLRSFATGTTSVAAIYNRDLINFEFSYPTLLEQQKIASFLTVIDTKIQQLTKKKNLLEQYKKGVMQQLFNQEIRFKNDDGGSYPDWVKGRFSKFIKLYRGSSPRPIIKYVTTNEDGVNWIKIGDTKKSNNYRISTVSEKITTDGSLKSRFVERGEIILANSMSFGKSYLLEIDGCIYDGWFVLREYEKAFDKEFLLQVLNSEFLQKQYFRLSTGGVVQNISSDIVYSTILFCPVREEQQKIAKFLSGLDKKIELVKTQLEQTQTFKKGLLQQMFV